MPYLSPYDDVRVCKPAKLVVEIIRDLSKTVVIFRKKSWRKKFLRAKTNNKKGGGVRDSARLPWKINDARGYGGPQRSFIKSRIFYVMSRLLTWVVCHSCLNSDVRLCFRERFSNNFQFGNDDTKPNKKGEHTESLSR